MNDKIKNVLEWVYCIVIAVVIAILIKYFVGTPTIVRQSSMYISTRWQIDNKQAN